MRAAAPRAAAAVAVASREPPRRPRRSPSPCPRHGARERSLLLLDLARAGLAAAARRVAGVEGRSAGRWVQTLPAGHRFGPATAAGSASCSRQGTTRETRDRSRGSTRPADTARGERRRLDVRGALVAGQVDGVAGVAAHLVLGLRHPAVAVRRAGPRQRRASASCSSRARCRPSGRPRCRCCSAPPTGRSALPRRRCSSCRSRRNRCGSCRSDRGDRDPRTRRCGTRRRWRTRGAYRLLATSPPRAGTSAASSSRWRGKHACVDAQSFSPVHGRIPGRRRMLRWATDPFGSGVVAKLSRQTIAGRTVGVGAAQRAAEQAAWRRPARASRPCTDSRPPASQNRADRTRPPRHAAERRTDTPCLRSRRPRRWACRSRPWGTARPPPAASPGPWPTPRHHAPGRRIAPGTPTPVWGDGASEPPTVAEYGGGCRTSPRDSRGQAQAREQRCARHPLPR